MAAKLRHLYHERTRHGGRVWYVRIGRGPRTRIEERYGTDEFFAAYHSALAGAAPEPAQRKRSDTLIWLVEKHKHSAYWAGLRQATRKQRLNILKHVLEGAAGIEIAKINRADIVAGRDRRMATPSQANNYLNTMRSIFQWAVAEGHMTADPSAGIGDIARPNTGGFKVWTEADVDAYVERWPLGTREYLALMVVLATGARRGDAVTLGPANILRVRGRPARLSFEAQKNGIVVTLPILPELTEAIGACPVGAKTFIARQDGRPRVKESFGNWFGENCRSAGLMKHNAHGLRKVCATRLTDAGATEAELDAAMGWTPGSRMSRIYTRARDNALLAERAFSRTFFSGAGKRLENTNDFNEAD